MSRPSAAAAVAFAVTSALAAAAVVVAAVLLPDRVPTHFGASGAADGWSTRTGAVTFLAVTVAGLTALFAVLARVAVRVPWTWVNLPGKQRWAELGRQDEVRRRLRADVLRLGAATALFEVALVGAVVAAARGDDRLPGWFPVVFGAWLLLVVVGAGIAPLVRYRPPAD